MAAEQGHADAQNNLGTAYLVGAGVPKDHAKAIRWFRKAADRKHVYAQDNLARVTALARARRRHSSGRNGA